MSKYIIQGETLTNIADAIRSKTGSTDPFTPAEMADAVSRLGSDDLKQIIDKTIIETILPEGLEVIGAYAFYACTRLEYIKMPESLRIIGTDAFTACSRIKSVRLPENVETIDAYAFSGCNNLTVDAIPANVKTIGHRAFSNCYGLTSIVFKGKPESISSEAFYNCTNLTTINVPWAEGAVANASWGATNATINYNYTGE
jgi:hypothetical protein